MKDREDNRDKVNKLWEILQSDDSFKFSETIDDSTCSFNIINEGLSFDIVFNSVTYNILRCHIPMIDPNRLKVFEKFYKVLNEADLFKNLPDLTRFQLEYIIEISKIKKENEENTNTQDIKNRVGKLYISEEALLSKYIPKAFEQLDIRIIKAEYLIHNNSFKYYFYSKFAEIVMEGQNVPKYIIKSTKTDFEQLIFELRKA